MTCFEDPTTHLLAALMNSPLLGVLVCTSEGRILLANPGSGSLLGRTATALVGKAALDFLHPEEQEECRDAFAELRLGLRAHLDREVRIVDGAGQTRWVRILAHRSPEPAKQRKLVVCLLDTTDYMELLAETGASAR